MISLHRNRAQVESAVTLFAYRAKHDLRGHCFSVTTEWQITIFNSINYFFLGLSEGMATAGMPQAAGIALRQPPLISLLRALSARTSAKLHQLADSAILLMRYNFCVACIHRHPLSAPIRKPAPSSLLFAPSG